MVNTEPVQNPPTTSQIDKAGDILRKHASTEAVRAGALITCNEWRLSHNYPMKKIRLAALKRAKRISLSAFVVQRLKRLPSIISKLERESTRLSSMQDLGGCRAVFENIKDAEKFFKRCLRSRSHHVVGEKNYVVSPKPNGYRSFHVIFSVHDDHAENDSRRIEVQVRTKLQHIWATAVEVCDTFTNGNLKSSKVPDNKWGRFFALMGSALAARESRPLVPSTPASAEDRKAELQQLMRDHELPSILYSWTLAVNPPVDKGERYILKLDRKKREMAVFSYGADRLSQADAHYFELEKEQTGNPDLQVVQVEADSLEDLKRAYPNYFIDIIEFIELLADESGQRLPIPKFNNDPTIRTVSADQKFVGF